MNKIGIVIIISALILTGCGQKEVMETSKEGPEIKIGVSFDSFVIERWYREQDAFISTIEALGATAYVQDANGEIEKQIKQIEYLIEEEVDAIVVIPTDGEAIRPVIQKAKEKGIKIIAYDRMINHAGVDLYITFDNEKIGCLMTKALLKQVGNKGNVLVIMGSPTDSNVKKIDRVFEDLIQSTDIQVLEKVYAQNWQAEVAFQTVSNHLKEGAQIDGIFCGNDDLAQQAIKALSEYRQAGEVCVVGQDADLSACQRIVEGTQGMTVHKNVLTLAEEAAYMAIKLVKGEPLKIEETINDGSYEVPYYKLDVIQVTKENMDEVIIDSGFHSKEAVYLNLVEK